MPTRLSQLIKCARGQAVIPEMKPYGRYELAVKLFDGEMNEIDSFPVFCVVSHGDYLIYRFIQNNAGHYDCEADRWNAAIRHRGWRWVSDGARLSQAD